MSSQPHGSTRRWPTGNADHIVPRCDDAFHIEVAREERYDSIRHGFAVLDEDAAEVTYNRWIVPDLKPRANGHLVASSRYDLWDQAWRASSQACVDATHQGQKRVPRECHLIRLLHDRCELKHLRIHVQRRDGTGGNDHAAEAFKDRLDGYRGIQASGSSE